MLTLSSKTRTGGSEGLRVWSRCLTNLTSTLSAASGVPQLVEPVLWDYTADLDVHGKGQCQVVGGVLLWPCAWEGHPWPCDPAAGTAQPEACTGRGQGTAPADPSPWRLGTATVHRCLTSLFHQCFPSEQVNQGPCTLWSLPDWDPGRPHTLWSLLY